MRKKGILALAVALTCLLSVSGTTYAYLKHTTEIKVAGIQSAEYALQIKGVFYAAQAVTVSEEAGESDEEATGTDEQPAARETGQEQQTGTELSLVNNSYTFTESGTAVFSLTASGTASGGYCMIKVVQAEADGTESEEVYYTDLIPVTISAEGVQGTEGYAVIIAANAETKVEFIAHWGIYSVTEGMKILESGAVLDLIGNEPAAVDIAGEEESETIKKSETEETTKASETVTETEETTTESETTTEGEIQQ